MRREWVQFTDANGNVGRIQKLVPECDADVDVLNEMLRAGKLYVQAARPGPLTPEAREAMARALRGEAKPSDVLEQEEPDAD